jgi:hypothetical protein
MGSEQAGQGQEAGGIDKTGVEAEKHGQCYFHCGFLANGCG